MASEYDEFVQRVRDIGRLHAVEALLEWDQEVTMPRQGVEPRAEQLALVAGLAHERLTDPRLGELLDKAAADVDGLDEGGPGAALLRAGAPAPAAADGAVATNIRETRRLHLRAVRVPTELVKRIAECSALAKDAWGQARQASDFARFEPHLSRLIDLKRELAACLGAEPARAAAPSAAASGAGSAPPHEPYDALLDEYEPGARAAELEALFSALARRSAALLRRIMASPHQPDMSLLARDYPIRQQKALSRELARALGFDFGAGRADVSVHPFCTTIGGPRDVRVTTRYNRRHLQASMYGTLHEVGHALYEQGLPAEHALTPRGSAVSLGIHESQSRMWENLVGRGRPFLQAWYPRLQKLFPAALNGVPLEDFYAAVNHVAPSCIRIEADELTYNLHIALRFQIERDLIAGRLAARDVPQRWNERMTVLVGVTPPDDAQGCLQDIHWSMGAFGYFPTYTLGNLYAAQFFAAAARDLPDLHADLAAGRPEPLLDWLRARIHGHGQRYQAAELVKEVTGGPPSSEPFMDYLTAKFSEVYRL
jgi:carboxypeptidase Taq